MARLYQVCGVGVGRMQCYAELCVIRVSGLGFRVLGLGFRV